jgi:hypothetical protein
MAQLPDTGTAPPVVAGRADAFARWRDLFDDLEREQCTPILGPGLLEPLLGSRREMARRWAERHGFPLATHVHDDLPLVAQFLAMAEKASLGAEFDKYLTTRLLEQFGTLIPAEGRQATPDDLLRIVARSLWERDPANPYRVLAALPCPLYITANPDNLLAEALRAAGKTAEVELCRWRDDGRWPAAIDERDPGYEPSVNRPLVYNLFGRLTLPFSLVLKEDDYFDYLIGVTRRIHLVPSAVQAALSDSGLLFLGFHLDDWSFRALFHSLIRQGAATQRGGHAHVAVQLDPQGASAADQERARYYLESYFEVAEVTIYWGRVEQFLANLQANWQRYRAAQEAP